MIKLCVFDMGGVMVRDFHIAPCLMPYLGYTSTSDFGDVAPELSRLLKEHVEGRASESELWDYYEGVTGRSVDRTASLLGRFFNPYLDEDTVSVVRTLKGMGMRVVCGTNVIDAHYKKHIELKQYDAFDDVYASHLIGLSKPSLEFFRFICSREGVKPEEVFFTDDSEENIRAGRLAGLVCHHYSDAASLTFALMRLGLL